MNRLHIEISWGSLWRILIMAGFVVLVYVARQAVLTLFLAIFVSAALDNIVRRLEGWGMPRLLGTIIIFLLVLAVITIILYAVVPIAIFELKSLFENLGSKISQIFGSQISSQLTNLINLNLDKIVNNLLQGGGALLDVVGNLMGGATFLIAVLILSFYLTVSRDGVGKFLRAVFPENLEDKVLSIYYRARKKIGRWFQAQLILGLVVGSLVFVGLWLLKVKYSLVLAIFAAIFEIVPVVGPIFAGAIAVIVAFTESTILGIYTAILFLAIQQLENHLLVPLVMRRAVDMHPVITLVSLLAGFQVGGVVGMILAVPAAVVFQEIFEDWVAKKSRRGERLKI